MSLDYRPQTVTADQYASIFETERAHGYPVVDALEARTGYAIARDRLEDAARVLACPLKAAAPNWQHGRVVYALTRKRLAAVFADEQCALLDIGTAKGFSALCARWALDDSGREGTVMTVDVMHPAVRVRRNTIAEVDGLRTLGEILGPWPETERIDYRQAISIALIQDLSDRIHVAFIDGKHTKDVVSVEWRLLSARQQRGDIAIFDDVQMPAVRAGLKGADRSYEFEYLELGSVNRAYAIGVRR